MEKFVRFLLSIVPIIVFFVVQVVVTFGVTIFILIRNSIKTGKSLEILFEELWTTGFSEYMLITNTVFGISALIVYSIWYYFYLKRPKLENPVQFFSGKSIFSIIAISLGMFALIDIFFQVVAEVNPVLIDQYMEMMEMAGITEMSVLTILSTVVFAPIYEELIFRGLVLRMAQKFTSKFWIANTFQAILFGIVHLNLLQGIYAFALGLILGYFYQKYQSLYVPILMHMIFNFIGSVMTEFVFSKISSELGWWIFLIVSIIIGIFGWIVLLKDKRKNVKEDALETIQL